MPIKPELRWFYPIDWKQVSHWVRFVRAKGRCQVCGRRKALRKDDERQKATYPRVVGLAESEARARAAVAAGIDALGATTLTTST